MAYFIMVPSEVDVRRLFKIVARVSVFSAFSQRDFGTMLIVNDVGEGESLRMELEEALTVRVMAFEVDTYVPDDWNARGFISDTLDTIEGDIDLLATSGLGLHIVAHKR